MFHHFKLLFAPLLLGMLCTSNAISETSQNSSPNLDPDKTDPGKVYMSFSGGGYHAHAGASAVMMSLMDRVRSSDIDMCDVTKVDMCDITKNVGAFSSNSGGSWFLSQAAYTHKFRKSLEKENAWKKYTKKPEFDIEGGYFGEAYHYISPLLTRATDTVVCDLLLDNSLVKKCKDELVGADSYLKFLLSGGDANWYELAKNAVFGQGFTNPSWNMVSDVNQSIKDITRQEWAEDKSLIFASSLLTDAPALEFPKVKLVPIPPRFEKMIPSLQGKQGGMLVPGATPVMFTVLGEPGDTKRSFLPGGPVTLQYGHWNRSAETKTAFESDGEKTSLPQQASIDQATILSVAASSSAAGAGFIDIPNMRASGLPDILASVLGNFAPAFTFKDGAKYHGPICTVITILTCGISLETAAEDKLVRLADGGFVDNTAVAYMVKYLADNGKLENDFNILAMDNYPSQPLVDKGTQEQFPTGPDVAGLFGYLMPAAKTHTTQLFGKFKYTGIVPHIFESDAYFKYNGTETGGGPPTTEPEWCAWIDPVDSVLYETESTKTKCVVIDTGNQSQSSEKHCNLYLSYTHYKVTVKENDYFGIDSDSPVIGTTGNLHVFAILGENTGVVPANEFQYRCYKKLMEGVHKAVTEKPGFGGKLASLLGLGEQ